MELKNLLNSSSSEQYDEQHFRRDIKTPQKVSSPSTIYSTPYTQQLQKSNNTQQNISNMKSASLQNQPQSPQQFNVTIQQQQQQQQQQQYPYNQGNQVKQVQNNMNTQGINTNNNKTTQVITNNTEHKQSNPNISLDNNNNNGNRGSIASYTTVGILEGCSAALRTVARYKHGELKNSISTKEYISGRIFDNDNPILLSPDVYNESRSSWSNIWKPESLVKAQPDIYIKDQKNGVNMKKSVIEYRNHIKNIDNDEDNDIWTAPDIPLMHQYTCIGSKKNRHCLGCSQFWKTAQSITEDLKPWGNNDMLRYEEEKNENFVGHLSMNNSFSPQKRETHAFDTINTMFYSDDNNGYTLWGFIAPYDVLHLTEDDSIGVQLFDQRTFIDPTFLESKVKVQYAIQKVGQTVFIPANWIYFHVRVGKGISLSASWNILRHKNIPDARRSVEMNRSVGIYTPYNLGSIILNSINSRLSELSSTETEKDRQSGADFLFRALPILKVLVLEELLDERVNINSLSIIAYDHIADQHRNGGINLRGICVHEVGQIRSNVIPCNDSYIKEDDNEVHSCALCKYVLFNSRRSCTVCNNLDFCENCHNISSHMHPHKFKLIRKTSVESIMDLVDSVKSFIKDYEPEEIYREVLPIISDKSYNNSNNNTSTSRKRPHPDTINNDLKQNTHLLGAPKENINNTTTTTNNNNNSLPGQQPLPPGVDSYESEEVIDCVCANNKDLGFMISCEKCFAWLHGKCVGISKRNEPAEYYCPRCTAKMTATSHRLAPPRMSPEERMKGYKFD